MLNPVQTYAALLRCHYYNSDNNPSWCFTAAAHNNFVRDITNLQELTLSLFVFWILTDNSDASFSFNDLAFFANRFN